MNKWIRRILILEIFLLIIFTLINLVYTFRSTQFIFISKVLFICLILLLLGILFYYLITKFTNKVWKVIIVFILTIGLNYLLVMGNKLLLTYNNAMARMGSGTQYQTSLITKKDSPYHSIEDINEATTIGIEKVTSSYENGSFALAELQGLNKTQRINQYESAEKELKALKDNKVDIISLSGLDQIENLGGNRRDYRVITTFTSTVKNIQPKIDITNTPFTLLIAGSDTRGTEIDTKGRSDANILVTFNPQSGHVTTLTTPRDSYVPLACNSGEPDKLTHASAYGGIQCTQKTLESLYDLKVDYNVIINFVGVIDIVNALGGVDIDVPVNEINASQGKTKVCEQNSHGKKGTICWEEGKVNTMNGEQALAFARNRYGQDGGDFYRGRNQQIVIEAILNKATKINNVSTISNLLTAVSKYMRTNLNTQDLLRLYQVTLNLSEKVKIEKLYVGGQIGTAGAMSIVYPDKDDMKYAEYRMKVNLDLVKPQFPTDGYYIDALKPKRTWDHPLAQELMPFNGTMQSKDNTK